MEAKLWHRKLFHFNLSLLIWKVLTGKKITKNWTSQERKQLFRWNKKYFHSFYLVKKKKKKKKNGKYKPQGLQISTIIFCKFLRYRIIVYRKSSKRSCNILSDDLKRGEKMFAKCWVVYINLKLDEHKIFIWRLGRHMNVLFVMWRSWY